MSSSSSAVLRHVVLLKFKQTTTEEDLQKITTEFHQLATVKVPEVKQFEWGTNVSKENLDHGYTHCFLLSFNNEADRDAYLVHKDHVAFVELIKPYMESATVIDYWAH